MDFGARNYDAAIGRWFNVDPLADQYVDMSPYNFVENNPLILIDLDGKGVFSALGEVLKGAGNAVLNSAKGLFSKGARSENQQTNQEQNETEYYQLLEPVDVASSPNDWGGDHSGFIRSATDSEHDNAPVLAFLMDLSAFGLNNFYPAGAVDDAADVAQNDNATAQDYVNAAINVVMAGAGGRGKGPKLSKVPKSKVVNNVGGKFTKTKEVRPGNGPGQSRAEYVRYKNSDGKTIRSYKDSYDRANKFQGRKPTTGDPEGRRPK